MGIARTARWALLLWAACVIGTTAGAAVLPPWTNQGRFVTAVATRGDQCYVATSDHGLWASKNGAWQAVALPVDDFVTSLAFDGAGRLWAGHGWHGVSVFDGARWQSYDAPDGPIGHRVFRIAVSPRDGDVWLATDLGLARYAARGDRWTYLTRAQGLPADQAAALAFAADGTLYVATQCDGIAVGSPADDYATWRVVAGPTREPVEAAGGGLPSNLVNDLLVRANGDVFAATCAGLAVSRDRGQTWSYVRGADYAEKVRGRTGGPPAGWSQAPAALVEDDVASLAEATDGNVWLGYRHRGAARVDGRRLVAVGPTLVRATTQPFALGESVRTIVVTPWGTYGGTAGDGLVSLSDEAAVPVEPTTWPAGANGPHLPSPARITPRAYDAMAAALAATPAAPLSAAYLGEDWVTRGDGAGRYGWQKVNFPFSGTGGWAQGYDVKVSVGPHQTQGGPYFWFDTNDTDDGRVLYMPNDFHRASGEWNDGSFDRERNPPTMEGPDLWLRVTVPSSGTHRLALYFISYDGRVRDNRFRDFVVEVKAGALTKGAADFAPALARARVSDFYEPVYKQFLLAGGSDYWVKITRNHSHVAKLAAAFLDRMPGPAVGASDVDRLPFPLLDPQQWGPPAAPPPADDEPAAVRSARRLWDELDARYADAAVVPLQLPLRMQAYRLAADNGASPALLANWRWHLHLWGDADRLEFCRQMDAGYQRTVGNNPGVGATPRTSMVDAYRKAHG
jgi:hypothetical protein